MKTAIFSILLAVSIPVETYLWFAYVNPFFWQPGIAYTDLAWGIVLVLFLFVSIPIGLLEEIIESIKK